MTDQTPTTDDLPQFLTDEEWREFQAIPDQGYSHRHWVNHKIAKYAAVHDRAVKAAALRELADEVRQGTGLYRCRLCAREYDVLEGRIGKFNYCFPDDTTQQNCYLLTI